MELVAADKEHIPILQQLAQIVWPATFEGIISRPQIEYMMRMMYSTRALERLFDTPGHHVKLVRDDNQYLGYISYESPGCRMKIHKIYVMPFAQGQGIGSRLMEAMLDQARGEGIDEVTLCVNRNNVKAVEFYKKMGFAVDSSLDTDIGSGFVMEDYIMKKIP